MRAASSGRRLRLAALQSTAANESGGIQHLIGAWLHGMTNTKVTFIAYKGAAQMVLDLEGGRLDVAPVTVLNVLQQIKSGKLRALTITTEKRAAFIPNVPTAVEQGIAGFVQGNWTGIVAPAATPLAVLGRLSEVLVATARAPDVTKPLEALGNIMVGSTAEQFRQILLSEIDRWRKVVLDNGIKVEQ